MKITAALLTLVLSGLLLAAATAFSADPAPATSTDVLAITKPSQDVTLSFTHPGRVAEMLVKEGDMVKVGQLIAKQDDTEEQAALEVADAQAKDATRVLAQEKVRDQKKSTYDRKKASGQANAQELEEAFLDWDVGKANVILSEFEHTQDARKADQARATLEKTRLHSPIAGRVEQTLIKAGENVDVQNMKVLRIVNIDPLWVEVPVPFSVARSLKESDPANVTFSNKEHRAGKIIHIATIADAASDTLLVRIEVPNSAKTPAGERVSVSFSPDSKVAAGAQ